MHCIRRAPGTSKTCEQLLIALHHQHGGRQAHDGCTFTCKQTATAAKDVCQLMSCWAAFRAQAHSITYLPNHAVSRSGLPALTLALTTHPDSSHSCSDPHQTFSVHTKVIELSRLCCWQAWQKATTAAGSCSCPAPGYAQHAPWYSILPWYSTMPRMMVQGQAS